MTRILFTQRTMISLAADLVRQFFAAHDCAALDTVLFQLLHVLNQPGHVTWPGGCMKKAPCQIALDIVRPYASLDQSLALFGNIKADAGVVGSELLFKAFHTRRIAGADLPAIASRRPPSYGPCIKHCYLAPLKSEFQRRRQAGEAGAHHADVDLVRQGGYVRRRNLTIGGLGVVGGLVERSVGHEVRRYHS